MRRLRFEFGRPQRVAAAMLLVFALECLWAVSRQTLTQQDYRYAQCGRELWEKPSPLAGYLTSCGNIADGTFAYRAAGLPLTLGRMVAGLPGSDSPWEMSHMMRNVLLLMRLPFIFFGVWLGGGLWWVSRRLFGNEGGFLALALYCFSPQMIRVSTTPNNEILAAWGVYGALYTAIGLAHAMQSPRRRWVPRMTLLAVALGLAAAAHIVAALIALVLGLSLMLYVAEGQRRAEVVPVMAIVAAAALVILIASYTFNMDAFSYVFESADAMVGVSSSGARQMLLAWPEAGVTIATVVALAVYGVDRRARYFGNTTPLLVAGLLLPLQTVAVRAEPWVWAMPFLLTLVGGVFADGLESKHRRGFQWLAVGLVAAQAVLCWGSLRGLVG